MVRFRLGLLVPIVVAMLVLLGVWSVWEGTALRQEALFAQTEADPRLPSASPQSPFAPPDETQTGGVKMPPEVTPPKIQSDESETGLPLIPSYPAPPAFQEGLLGNDVELVDGRPLLRRIEAPRDAVVREIHVKTEQTVKKGDLLMKLSSSELEWQIINVQGKLEKSEVNLSALQRKKSQWERLAKEAAASEDQILDLTTRHQLAQIEVATRKKQLDHLMSAQKELTLNAPVDGVIRSTQYNQPDLEALLLNCPVERGNWLLFIGALPDAKNEDVKLLPDAPLEPR